MKLDTPRLPVHYVDSGQQLELLTGALEGYIGHIGLDAERASGFRYSNQAYLIQIAIPGLGIYLIDPLPLREIPEFSKFREILGSKSWILHAATQDIPCLLDLGIAPTALFDTELAAKLVGLKRVGLSAISQELLDFELAKEHSASDWSIRPLTQEMLSYAALDVDVLQDLHDALTQKLSDLGRKDWANQEMHKLTSFRPKEQASQPWRSLPGVSKFREVRQLQIAAGLWLVRDKIAQEQDVAPGKLIPDRSISFVAQLRPKTKAELASQKEFIGRASRKLLDHWWKAIVDSESLALELKPALDENHMPNHKIWERKFPDAHQRLERVRPNVIQLAEEIGIPQEVLISPEVIRRICFSPEADSAAQLKKLGARSWQIELVLPILLEALQQD